MTECIIVVPCYNEARRLQVDAFKEFTARGRSHRFFFVDDCSTDNTREVLEHLRLWDPQRFVVRDLAKNCGKAEAVPQGMLEALRRAPALVGFWDADLATPLDAIPQFCAVLEANPELQLVMGSRVRLLGASIERRLVRHYVGRVFATAASLVLKLPVYDTQCGAKLIRVAPTTRALFAQPFRTNWAFDVELLARFLCSHPRTSAQSAAAAICEIPLSRWRDVEGSKVKARDFFKALLELYTIHRTYFRSAGSPGAPAPRWALPVAPSLRAGGARSC